MPKILLVEDNEMNRDMLSRRLQRKGYEVVIAVDGGEGVALAHSQLPDLILMDIGMPRMDGLTALWKMREYPELAHVPVVIISAYDSYDLRGEAASAGCQGYLTKPIDHDDLKAMIKRVLRS